MKKAQTSKDLTLRVFRDDIMFQFEDEAATLAHGKINQTAFQEKTSWGFIYKNPKASTESARWGIVTHLGPDVDPEITIGSKILIAPLKWTNAIEFNRTKYWKTNVDQVLAIEE